MFTKFFRRTSLWMWCSSDISTGKKAPHPLFLWIDSNSLHTFDNCRFHAVLRNLLVIAHVPDSIRATTKLCITAIRLRCVHLAWNSLQKCAMESTNNEKLSLVRPVHLVVGCLVTSVWNVAIIFAWRHVMKEIAKPKRIFASKTVRSLVCFARTNVMHRAMFQSKIVQKHRAEKWSKFSANAVYVSKCVIVMTFHRNSKKLQPLN